MTTGARVTIGGASVASKWDGTDLVAVNGLSIRWGRSDPYEGNKPGLLTLTLVDRTGTFISDNARVGQEVRVEMIDPAQTMFRGAITAPKATRARVHNPLSNQPETVWLVTINAADPLAALDMAVFRGDALDGWVEGAGGWSEVDPNQRLDRLWEAGASGIVSGYEAVPDVIANPPIRRRIRGQAAADARTALELIRQVYDGVPLGTPAYNPNTDTVSLAQFIDSSSVRLVLSGGVVRIDLPTGRVVPASRVGVNEYTVESDAADALDVVQVGYHFYGRDPSVQAGSTGVKRVMYTEGFIEARTARYKARTRRVLKLATQFITFDTSEFQPGARDEQNRFPAWLLDRVTAIVNKLNGQVRLPRLTFDARRMPLPADLEALIYRPVPTGVPLYFTGSVFNTVPGAGPQLQVLGGTLSYDKGWRHDVNVCATGAATESALTLAQLSAHATATLGDVDPDLSMADLAYVTTGLPA